MRLDSQVFNLEYEKKNKVYGHVLKYKWKKKDNLINMNELWIRDKCVIDLTVGGFSVRHIL